MQYVYEGGVVVDALPPSGFTSEERRLQWGNRAFWRSMI